MPYLNERLDRGGDLGIVDHSFWMDGRCLGGLVKEERVLLIEREQLLI
ncbi:MAG: hypothetical protein HRU41_36000 [Saprospiraceae bacterium]|nr:hypothetical protein [Saprospiraceae bacterium]